MRTVKVLFMLAMAFAVAACGAAQATDIYNSKNISFPNSTTSMEKIEKAIITAGAKRGWIIEKVADGKMKGVLHIRRHMAEVAITYDKEKFNIEYVNSTNLNYDPKDKVIHKNYNSWIKNLENDIKVFVSAYGP